MPSYAPEQKRRALEVPDECGGRAARAICKLGYPARRTTCQWADEGDASHARTAGPSAATAPRRGTRPAGRREPPVGDEAGRTLEARLELAEGLAAA